MNNTTLTREELILSSRLSECCSSGPDSELVAFTHKKICEGGKKSATNLYLHNATSMRTTQLTHNESGAVSNPVFAQDLPGAEDALLYMKSSDSQVWALPLGGGESSKVSSFPLPVESFKVFAGTGTKVWMLLVMGVYPGCSPAETVARDAAKEGGSSGMEFTQLMVRHWDTWNCYEKRNHLFLCQLQVRADGMLQAPAEGLYDLMLHWESDCPAKVCVRACARCVIGPLMKLFIIGDVYVRCYLANLPHLHTHISRSPSVVRKSTSPARMARASPCAAAACRRRERGLSSERSPKTLPGAPA